MLCCWVVLGLEKGSQRVLLRVLLHEGLGALGVGVWMCRISGLVGRQVLLGSIRL